MKKVVLVVAAVATLAAVVGAQGQSAAPADGTTQALVTELRALRGDLNRIAGASIRMQLLVGRLQLQEQRILTLSRQMADVAKEVSNVSQARVAIESQIKQIEDGEIVDPQEREQAAKVVEQIRPQLAQHRKREQELRQQEASLSAMMAEEQNRWSDFSSRLDELERVLATPRPR